MDILLPFGCTLTLGVDKKKLYLDTSLNLLFLAVIQIFSHAHIKVASRYLEKDAGGYY